MMKSWADHCSSDEESVDDGAEEQGFEEPPQGAPQPEDEEPYEEAPRVYDFPDKPPFTAFVGNLAFSVMEPDQLKAAITDTAAQRGVQINVIGGRIATDRRDNKHRGFGYVEVETLDQLKLLMTLNDGQSMIAGRKIQLDTANQANHNQGGPPNHNNHHHNNNHHQNDNRRDNNHQNDNRRSSARPSFEQHRRGPAPEKIDGSNFQGGRHSQNDRRSTGISGVGGGGSHPQGQRPSLKLAPRTKPREEKPGAATNIFGGAKARDEGAWEKKRMSKPKEEATNKDGNVTATTAAAHKDTKAVVHKDTKAVAHKDPKAVVHKDTKAVAHKDTKEGAHKDTTKAVAAHKDTKDGERRRSPQSGRGRAGGRGRGGGSTGGGRGGKGESGSGRGGGKADTNNHKQRGSNARRNSPQNQQSPEEKAAVAAAAEKAAAAKPAAAKPVAVPTPAPAKNEVTNKFALLMDSDSD